MKKTLKTLSVALMLFLLLIFAVSCAGNQEPVDTGTESNEQTTGTESVEQTTGNGGLNKDPIEHVHEYGELTLIMEPTCKSIGRIGRKCSCGLAVKERDLPKADHVYNVSNVCVTCGKRIIPSQGLEFQSSPINGKAQFTLTGIGTCKDKNIVVPAYYKGAPVVKIDDNAFRNSDIVSIYIPSTVKEISSGAFNLCTNLKTVSLPSTIKEIGSAFNNCHKLEYSKYEGCLYLGSDTNPYLYLMENEAESIPELKIHHDTRIIAQNALDLQSGEPSSIHIPANLQCIEDVHLFRTIEKIYIEDLRSFCSLKVENGQTINTSLFLKGELVTELEIPEGVEQISNCLLAKNTSLVSVKIPKTLTKITENAFSECTGLKAVYIDDLNSWCGINFENEKSNPLNHAKALYLDGVLLRNLEIPDGVTQVGAYAFYNAKCLNSVVIPSSVKEIDFDAFANCNNLLEVYNLSSLSVDRDYNNGLVANYALNIFTNKSSPSGLTQIGDFIFFKNSEKCYLLAYTGNEKNIVMPAGFNGEAYEIYDGILNTCTFVEGVSFEKNCLLSEINLHSLLYKSDSIKNLSLPSGIKEILCNNFTNRYLYPALEGIYIDSLEDWLQIEFTDGNPLMCAKYLYVNNERLTDFVIPSTLTQLNDKVFMDYSGLNSISFEDNCQLSAISDYAFKNCDGLNSVSLPTSIETIGMGAFEDSDKLVKIELPEGVKHIGERSFKGCGWLVSVTLPSTLEEIGTDGFSGCYFLYEIYNLSDLVITSNNENGAIGVRAKDIYTSKDEPGKLIEINGFSFYVLSDESSILICYTGTENTVVMPSEVAGGGYSVNSDAFSRSPNIEKLTIANCITDFCFNLSNCAELKELTIGSGVTRIEVGVFDGCKKIEKVTFAENSQLLSINERLFKDNTLLKTITIPKSVTAIYNGAFSGCTSLETVIFEEGSALKTIDKFAFKGCPIKSIVIPENVTNIEMGAFVNCNELQSIVFMDTEGWVDSNGSSLDVTDPEKNAEAMIQDGWGWKKRK